jgi:hypothetical protein
MTHSRIPPQHSWSAKNIFAGGPRKQTLKNVRLRGKEETTNSVLKVP